MSESNRGDDEQIQLQNPTQYFTKQPMVNNLSEITYIKPNIASFPTLQPFISHGFSWGKDAGNFSFTFAGEDKIEVLGRNVHFFNELGFGQPRKAILIIPEHKDNIVVVDEETLNQKGHYSGINIKCDAAFTYDPGVTISVKVADCQTYYVYGENKDGKAIKGIVHSGWKGTNLLFSEKIAHFLIEVEKILPETIKIGLVPGIFQKNRTVQNFSDIDGDISHWGDFQYFKNGNYNLDSRNFTISQLTNSGIHADNIWVYDINTFDEAKKGNCFSQKYEYLEESGGREVVKGRFIVAMRS